MKFIPILFSTPMVQANIVDKKSVTRRLNHFKNLNDLNKKGHDFKFNAFDLNRETVNFECLERNRRMIEINPFGNTGDILWVRETFSNGTFENGTHTGFRYKADDENYNVVWKPSIFMPKQACRLFLEIQNVSVSKLQTMNEKDAQREGFDSLESFIMLWDKINPMYQWNTNPYVWVIEYKKINPSSELINQFLSK